MLALMIAVLISTAIVLPLVSAAQDWADDHI